VECSFFSYQQRKKEERKKEIHIYWFHVYRAAIDCFHNHHSHKIYILIHQYFIENSRVVKKYVCAPAHTVIIVGDLDWLIDWSMTMMTTLTIKLITVMITTMLLLCIIFTIINCQMCRVWHQHFTSSIRL